MTALPPHSNFQPLTPGIDAAKVELITGTPAYYLRDQNSVKLLRQMAEGVTCG